MTRNQVYEYISVTALCATLLWISLRRAKRHEPLPPSPKPDRLIGNLRTMLNIVDEPRAYRDWGLELGSDIISISVPGQVIIVLNSQEAVDELFVKRSSIYSDRPQVPMISNDKLVGWGSFTALLGYGERWRFHRRMMHEVLQKNANEARWPIMEKDSRLALQRILADPNNFTQALICMTGSTLLMSVYGYEVISPNDSLLKTVETAVSGFHKAAMAQINTFPWLEYTPEWFPGAAWKAKARLWREQKDQMLHVPFEWTKSRIAAGTETPCMLSIWLNNMHQESTHPAAEVEEDLRWIAGGMFAAATDTVVSTIRAFILAMAMHPDIQAKAQAQVDSAIGTRLPEMADQDSLPYVRCIIKGVMRWRMSGPLDFPRRCVQDDIFKGYHIPKGSAVMGNVWAIGNNPDAYPDPDRFNPDRFLDPSVPEPPVFGSGRRICPGSLHAPSVVFITVAGLLAMFDIRPEEDENGKPIPLKADEVLNEVLRWAWYL